MGLYVLAGIYVSAHVKIELRGQIQTIWQLKLRFPQEMSSSIW